MIYTFLRISKFYKSILIDFKKIKVFKDSQYCLDNFIKIIYVFIKSLI